MSPEAVEALFTRSDGQYLFARWGRPLAPVVFGVEDETLAVVKGAFEVVAGMVGHPIMETDPELGSNVMVFFLRDWADLLTVPDLDRLIDDLGPMVDRLADQAATQYRVFRFDETGAIKACFLFIRMDKTLSEMPAEAIALAQVVQAFVLWSDTAFAETSPLGQLPGGEIVLRPEVADVIRAVYDPVMPAVARDKSHALRVAARIGRV